MTKLYQERRSIFFNVVSATRVILCKAQKNCFPPLPINITWHTPCQECYFFWVMKCKWYFSASRTFFPKWKTQRRVNFPVWGISPAQSENHISFPTTAQNHLASPPWLPTTLQLLFCSHAFLWNLGCPENHQQITKISPTLSQLPTTYSHKSPGLSCVLKSKVHRQSTDSLDK